MVVVLWLAGLWLVNLLGYVFEGVVCILGAMGVMVMAVASVMVVVLLAIVYFVNNVLFLLNDIW